MKFFKKPTLFPAAAMMVCALYLLSFKVALVELNPNVRLPARFGKRNGAMDTNPWAAEAASDLASELYPSDMVNFYARAMMAPMWYRWNEIPFADQQFLRKTIAQIIADNNNNEKKF